MALTTTEKRVLKVLLEADRPPTYLELGREADLSETGARKVVQRLEEKGFVVVLRRKARSVKVNPKLLRALARQEAREEDDVPD